MENTISYKASPYPGLRYFDSDDREYFFGREGDRESIIANLFSIPLSVYYGTSGVGKTSLLLADIIPVLTGLKQPGLRGDPALYHTAAVVLVREWKEQEKVDALIRERVIKAIQRCLEIDPTLFCEELFKEIAERADPDANDKDLIASEAFLSFLPAAIAKASRKKTIPPANEEERRRLLFDSPLSDFLAGCVELFGGRILLIFDQFEEYFRYRFEDSASEGFEMQFAGVLKRSDLPVNILLSLREEAIAKLDRFQSTVAGIFRNMLRIKHLDRTGIRRAISEPLKQLNDRRREREMPPVVIDEKFRDSLVDEVLPRQGVTVKDVENGQTRRKFRYSGTAYLQMLLASTWRQMVDENSLTLSEATMMAASRNFHFGSALDVKQSDTETFQSCARRIADGYVRRLIVEDLDRLWNDMPLDKRDKFQPVNPERARDLAAKTAAFLVTPAGAKVAQSIDDLCQNANSLFGLGSSSESRIAEVELDAAMRLLEEVGLVRMVGKGEASKDEEGKGQEGKSEDIGGRIYEMTHDVLGVAMDRWREEYLREKASEQARRDAAGRANKVVGMIAMIVFFSGLVLWVVYSQIASTIENTRTIERMTNLRTAEEAYAQLEKMQSPDPNATDSSLPNESSAFPAARVFALATVLPSDEGNTRNRFERVLSAWRNMISTKISPTLTPPSALTVIRYVTPSVPAPVSNVGITTLPNKLGSIEAYLPIWFTRDRVKMVTLEEPDGRTPYVWDAKDAFRFEYQMKAAPEPIVAMYVDDGSTLPSYRFIARLTSGKTIAWTLARNASWQEIEKPKTAFRSLPSYKDEDPRQPYSSYSEIATRWVHDALADLVPVQFNASLSSYIKFVPAETAKLIEAAMKDGEQERDVQIAAQKLVSATQGNFSLSQKEALRVIDLRNKAIKQQAAMRLLNEANGLAKEGKEEDAIKKYEEVQQVPGFDDLDPKREAQTWRTVGLFENALAEARQSVVSGNLEATKTFLEKAKSLAPHLWGTKNVEEEANKLIQRLRPAASGSAGPEPVSAPQSQGQK